MSLLTGAWKKYPEFENIIKQAGYRKPTRLQELVLPPILEKRDVLVESGLHPGKTLSIVTSVILRGIRGPGISVLVLTKERDQGQKLFRMFTGMLGSFLQGSAVVSIGFSDLIKKEARQLSEGPDIVIGTPSRLIDHIRRNNVDLAGVDIVFIDEDEEYDPAFENDLCFIFSKLKGIPQIVRFSFARECKYSNIEKMMKRPVVIQEKDFSQNHGTIQYAYLVADNLEKLFFKVLLSLDFDCVIVVVDSAAFGKKLLSALKDVRLEGMLLQKETKQTRIEKAIDCAANEHLDVVITIPETLPHINLEGISHVVFYGEPSGDEPIVKYVNPAQLAETTIQCILLTITKNETEFLAKQERHNVKMEKKEIPSDESVIKGTIERLFRKSEAAGKAVDINQYEKTVRKVIPFGKRTAFISYLLKQNLQMTLAKELEFVTLFLNVGRLKGASAREIAALFESRLSLDKSMIKAVRLFDNYCFVEIAKDYADAAIKGMHDCDYKGKKLIVNYSRQKPERRDFDPRRRRRS